MNKQTHHPLPGPIALFGSGETAPSGQKIFDFIFKKVPLTPKVALLETPAGFELNSEQVANNVSEFISDHLKNYKPKTSLIPARKKGTDYSPDSKEIVFPILEADLIFMGPGSPSYAVRQLEDSLAWEYITARHRLGAGLALSSATTVAISSFALPVYEIYKVGQDLHWNTGLNLFSPYQLSLTFIPHWNNQDGGSGLDTSRCYMGKSRFEELAGMLPEDNRIIGIDEHTGLIIDFEDSCMHVIGSGNVTIITGGNDEVFPTGCAIELIELGDYQLPDPKEGIAIENWNLALEVQQKSTAEPVAPDLVLSLAEKRQNARFNNEWETADQLRKQIEDEGWIIKDSQGGFTLEKKNG